MSQKRYPPELRRQVIEEILEIEPRYFPDEPGEPYSDAEDYARVLTWRALDQFGVKNVYTAATARHHKQKGVVRAKLWMYPEADTPNMRMTMYNLNDAFTVKIEPAKAEVVRRRYEKQHAEEREEVPA